ncbi:Hsp20/alpha crystallin family protein [Patescibacteria group bacterium]|nr:Hsp20/alpha crystallin family protein [Patescibacteria group bacterium]MBU1922143.1 Hsp20/alpha crystallin family protein [Patescibacteria group bacterium]
MANLEQTILPPNQNAPRELGSEKQEWLDHPNEGELSVDVFEQDGNVIIKSTIAGVKPQDIDISIENDMVTIRGKRHEEETARDRNFFVQECYWGNFSRTIILPTHVRGDQAEAILKNGVLKLTIPKATGAAKINIEEIPEEI